MDVTAALNAGLDVLKKINAGTLTYNGQSITVFKSYLRNRSREMQENGYMDGYDDLYVLAKLSDVSSWGLLPQKTLVTLDGVEYRVGQSTTSCAGYMTIFLKLKQ
jgi:hypothetical protein